MLRMRNSGKKKKKNTVFAIILWYLKHENMFLKKNTCKPQWTTTEVLGEMRYYFRIGRPTRRWPSLFAYFTKSECLEKKKKSIFTEDGQNNMNT